jgi:hypothetical protein
MPSLDSELTSSVSSLGSTNNLNVVLTGTNRIRLLGIGLLGGVKSSSGTPPPEDGGEGGDGGGVSRT